jgi:lipoyl(octanoyl) transferase
MEARADAIRAGAASELVWLVEHPPLYTAGTSADPAELFNPLGFPVYAAGRGGRYTYHGPGQRVGYVMVDLARRGRDVRRYVHALEQWVIDALGELGVAAHRLEGRIGIWVRTGPGAGRGSEGGGVDGGSEGCGGEAKVGAIGVRVRRWVTMHGFAVNLCAELSHFSGIVPCGIGDLPVTGLDEMGVPFGHGRFDLALRRGLGAFLSSLEGGTREA